MSPWWLAVGTVLAGVGLRDHLSGANLALDTLDWLRLSGRRLAECDRRWQANPRRSDLVVCMTTIPSRLPFLRDTLKSLLCQSMAPARIRLHLPEYSRREQCPYVVPEWLARVQGVEVVRTEDLGPATKLLPALSAFGPDQGLVVVDDDRLYPPDLISRFDAWGRLHPDIAIGSSGWRVPADLVDRPTSLWSNLLRLPPTPVPCSRVREAYPVDILQGFSGYLVRPRFVRPEVFDYSGAPRAAFFVDDVWISGHLSVPRVVLPARRFSWVPPRMGDFYRRTSLGLINRHPDPAQRHNSIVLQHLAHRWLC